MGKRLCLCVVTSVCWVKNEGEETEDDTHLLHGTEVSNDSAR